MVPEVCATGLLHHTTSKHAAEAGTQMTCPPPQPTKPAPTHPKNHCGCPVLALCLASHRSERKGGDQICSLPVAYYGTSRIMYKVIWDPTWVPSIYSRKGGSAIPAPASAPVHRCCIVASSLCISPFSCLCLRLAASALTQTRPHLLRRGSAAAAAHPPRGRKARNQTPQLGAGTHALAADSAARRCAALRKGARRVYS